MSYDIEAQSPYVAWTEPSALLGYRNVVGTPCVDIYTSSSPGYSQVPGVLRLEAISEGGGNMTWRKTIIQAADIGHPDEGDVVITATPNPLTWYDITSDTQVMLSSPSVVGDIFDVWFGYDLDEDAGLFLPVMAFGLVFQDTLVEPFGLRITNNSVRHVVSARLIWDPEFIQVKHSDDLDWDTTGQLILHDASINPGVLYPSGIVTLDVRPFTSVALDPDGNLYTIDLSLYGAQV